MTITATARQCATCRYWSGARKRMGPSHVECDNSAGACNAVIGHNPPKYPHDACYRWEAWL